MDMPQSQLRRRRGAQSSRGRSARSRVFRPLEPLEDRTLLSASIPLNASTWTAVGPAPILLGQTPGRMPVSGRVVAIAADPTDARTIYVAAAGGGVWKTTDGGTKWRPLTDDQETLFMGALAVAPSNPNVIYAGTGEADYSGDSFYGRGILKSTDGGNSWTLQGRGQFDRMAFTKIAVDPTNPNVAYAAVGEFFATFNNVQGVSGLFKTTDGGANWINTTGGISTSGHYSDVVIDPASPSTVYVAVGSAFGDSTNGVYKSTDGGNTWAAAGDFPGGGNAGVIRLGISAADSKTVYATISDTRTFGLNQIVKSTDGGAKWTATTKPVNYLGGQGFYDSTLAVDPTDASRVYVGGSFASFSGGNFIQGMLESVDGGQSWVDISVGVGLNGPHVDHHAVGFTADGKFLDGNDGGIWQLDDPNPTAPRWSDLNGNLQITQFVGIALDPTDPNIAYGGSQDNGTEKFTDDLKWTLVQQGDGGRVRVDQSSPNTVYHTFFYANYAFLERSDDGGATWTGKVNGINTRDNGNFYPQYVMDPSDSKRLLLGTDRIYETTDRADNWTAISSPNSNGWSTSAIVDQIAIAPTDPKTIYAATGGDFSSTADLFVTNDDGKTWTKISIPGASDHFGAIAVDDTDKKTAYVARDYFDDATHRGRMFKTTDSGKTWTDISGNLPNIPVHSIVQIHQGGLDVLVIGTDKGVFATYDGGTNWSSFKPGLPNVQVTELVYNATTNILAAGTYGRGMYETLGVNPLSVQIVPLVGVGEGIPLETAIVATMTDLSGSHPASFYTATIDWGDGNVGPGIIQQSGLNTFQILGSNTYLEGGTYTLKVTVSDAVGDSSTATSRVVIVDAPLTAQGIPGNAVEGTAFSATLAHFTDADPNPTTIDDYTVTIDWKDGTVNTGTVVANPLGGFDVLGSHTYAEEGAYNVLIRIDDRGGARATALAAINVDDAPLSATPVPLTAVEGRAFSRKLMRFVDANPNGALGDFSATIDWGDGTISTGVIAKSGGGFDVTGGHLYQQYGTYGLTVTVDDVGGGSAQIFQSVAVSDAPLTATATAFTISEGLVFSGGVATFSDANPNGRAGEFTATISWGDGTTTSGSIAPTGNSNYRVTGSHVYEEGTFPVHVTIRSVGGATTSSDYLVTVADAPLTGLPQNINSSEGTIYTGVVARFTDANPRAPIGDFSATIDWGDGTLTTGDITFGGGRFEVFGSHTYGEGVFTISTSVFDVGGSTVVIKSTATVPDAPIAATAIPLSLTEGQAFTGTVAHFTDANPISLPSNYNVTIAWGDGTTTPGVVAASPSGGFDVLGQHSFEEGTFVTSVAITDESGHVTRASTTTIVFDAPITALPAAVSASEGTTFTGTVATFTDGNINAPIGDFSATIRWGDGTTSPGGIVDQGGGHFSVTGTHIYATGTYSASVAIKDVGGSSATASFNVTVANAPITATGSDFAAIEGSIYSGPVATFLDGNPRSVATEYTTIIQWGDGTQSAGEVQALPAGGFVVNGTHTFRLGGPASAPRPYKFLVQVTDAAGGTAQGTGTAQITDAPLFITSNQITAEEGRTFTGTVASFTDGNSLAVASDFSARIDWGDGSDPTFGTVTSNKIGGFKVTGDHIYAAGDYSAKVTILDIGGTSAEGPVKVSVPNAKISVRWNLITPFEGVPFSGMIGTLTDGNPLGLPTDYSLTVTRPDKSQVPAHLNAQGGGVFQVVVDGVIFRELGGESLTISVDERGGSKATGVTSVTVKDAPLTAQGLAVAATEQQGFVGAVATFQDANPAAEAADTLASIDWGDGTTTPGTLIATGGGTFVVQGTHTYGEAGAFTLRVSLQGDGGASATALGFMSVADLLFPLTGVLTSTSDSGVSRTDGITNVNRPTLVGSAEPLATVTVFSQVIGSAQKNVLGSAQADALGAWSFTPAEALSDGSYAITVSAIDHNGRTSSNETALYPSTGRGALVIDTVGPHVSGITLTTRGRMQVYFDDAGGSGAAAADMLDPGSYRLATTAGKTIALTSLTKAPDRSDSAVLNFALGRRPRGGYVMTIRTGTFTDVAGNILDERIYTPFPSVDRRAGQDYIALFTTDGRTVQGPQQYVPPNEILAASQFKQFVRGKRR